MSQPWHVPYHIIAKNDPDVTVVKVYFPEEGQILIYWYDGNRKSPGRVPQWVQKLFCNEDKQNSDQEASESEEYIHELEDEKSITSESESDPVPIVKQRVPPPSDKGRYSLRDGIMALQRLV